METAGRLELGGLVPVRGWKSRLAGSADGKSAEAVSFQKNSPQATAAAVAFFFSSRRR
jgi:hypothetical protein